MISVSCLDLCFSVEPTEEKPFKDETEDETDFVVLRLTQEDQSILPQISSDSTNTVRNRQTMLISDNVQLKSEIVLSELMPRGPV